ncbi:unnamed protein product [Phytophthora fragariaefolia]|uniref:Unnamed protein product n=1 Tax=Phytophthora fragariaefolia TaxID=1490495 RepID=A0A9W6Y8Q2_9STRA|nr:unnamed protein product [Phytophthora fragariaefolia]
MAAASKMSASKKRSSFRLLRRVLEASTKGLQKIIAPVVALILHHVTFDRHERYIPEVEHLQYDVLNKITGSANTHRSININEILEVLIAEDGFPDTDRIRRWINPTSGILSPYPLQHTINFAYCVDGRVEPIRESVGSSSCEPPTCVASSANATIPAPVNGNNPLFDPFQDDDDTAPDHAEVGATPVQANGGLAEAKRPRDTSSLTPTRASNLKRPCQSTRDRDANIIEKLMDDPELLDHFLTLSQNRAGSHSSDDAVSWSPAPAYRDSTKNNKHSFTPRDEQQLVHARITAQPHRAMHFTKLRQESRITWYESGGANFENLSATAAVAMVLRMLSPTEQHGVALGFIMKDRREIAARATASTPSTPRVESLKLQVNSYVGREGEPLLRWLVEVDTAITARRIVDPLSKVAFAMSCLGGRARGWAYGRRITDPTCFSTYEVFKQELRQASDPPQNEIRSRAEFLDLQQGKHDVHAYAQRARYLVSNIVTNPIDEATKVVTFMKGLRDGPVKTYLSREYPSTLKAAITLAMQKEFSLRQAKLHANAPRQMPPPGF